MYDDTISYKLRTHLVVKAWFSYSPKHNFFQDSLSHRIFAHMHGALNIYENKN